MTLMTVKRSHRLRQIIGTSILALGVLVATSASGSAEARTVVGVGVGFGVPLWGPAYVPPAYYPPAYPPAYYYPPRADTTEDYGSVAPTAYSSQECREYTSTQTIGGRPQTVVGTACLQPDGSWRIVR